MIIHRPELAETDVRSEISQVEQTIAADGAVTDVDFWGKRRFAYEMDKHTEGYYSVVTFQSESGLVNGLERALSLADTVIRHKVVRRA
jgi:small subunit ribosomal protein S6